MNKLWPLFALLAAAWIYILLHVVPAHAEIDISTLAVAAATATNS